jgi:hypothetical protein
MPEHLVDGDAACSELRVPVAFSHGDQRGAGRSEAREMRTCLDAEGNAMLEDEPADLAEQALAGRGVVRVERDRGFRRDVTEPLLGEVSGAGRFQGVDRKASPRMAGVPTACPIDASRNSSWARSR